MEFVWEFQGSIHVGYLWVSFVSLYLCSNFLVFSRIARVSFVLFILIVLTIGPKKQSGDADKCNKKPLSLELKQEIIRKHECGVRVTDNDSYNPDDTDMIKGSDPE